jgi:hypothetical protein
MRLHRNAARLFVFALVVTTASACSCGPKSCANGQPCDTGTVCGPAGTCVAPTFTSFTIPAEARGCEVLLTEQAGTTFDSAKFGTGVVGTSLREAPRVAITFVAAKDTAITADQVQLALTSGSAAGLSITRASCVDVTGSKLPNATVSLR